MVVPWVAKRVVSKVDLLVASMAERMAAKRAVLKVAPWVASMVAS